MSKFRWKHAIKEVIAVLAATALIAFSLRLMAPFIPSLVDALLPDRHWGDGLNFLLGIGLIWLAIRIWPNGWPIRDEEAGDTGPGEAPSKAGTWWRLWVKRPFTLMLNAWYIHLVYAVGFTLAFIAFWASLLMPHIPSEGVANTAALGVLALGFTFLAIRGFRQSRRQAQVNRGGNPQNA